MEEVLFVSGLPLDFEDIVRVPNMDGSLDVTAKFVAMHLYDDEVAIAAKVVEAFQTGLLKPDGRAGQRYMQERKIVP